MAILDHLKSEQQILDALANEMDIVELEKQFNAVMSKEHQHSM